MRPARDEDSARRRTLSVIVRVPPSQTSSSSLRVDPALIARLEHGFAASAARYAQVRAQRWPACGARTLQLRPGVVVVDSGAHGGENASAAYGLGLDERAPTDADLDVIEDFYSQGDGAPRAARISTMPTAHASLVELLARRGYHPARSSSLMARAPAALPVSADVRRLCVTDAEAEGGVDLVVAIERACYAGSDDERDVSIRRVLPLLLPPSTMFAIDDAACGALVVDAAAGTTTTEPRLGLLFAGMCKPSHRGRGLQSALIRARVARAHELGLDLVASMAAPASTSERNLRRAGFDLVCTTWTWTRGEAHLTQRDEHTQPHIDAARIRT